MNSTTIDADFDFTYTSGGWTDWQHRTITTALNSGNNTIRLQTSPADGSTQWFNLDSLAIYPAGTPAQRNHADINPAAGWELVEKSLGNDTQISIYQRVATTPGATASTFELTNKATTATSVSAYTPSSIEAVATHNNNTATNHVHPSVSPHGTNRRLVTFAGLGTATTSTPAAGMAEHVDVAATGPTTNVSLHSTSQSVTNPGATGTRTTTSTTATTSATITVALGTGSSNLYGADRQRLLRADANGDITLYLGATELTATRQGTVHARRYYNTGASTAAVRDETGLTLLLKNYNASIVATIDRNQPLNIGYNHYTPYGQPRTPLATATDRSYIGQTYDQQSNLSYLNNRHYDPALGSFLSVDPLVSTTGEPYVYGSANPVTLSDPDGLMPCVVRSCPDGIPVVHYDRHDMRSWLWPALKFNEPDPIPTAGTSIRGRTRPRSSCTTPGTCSPALPGDSPRAGCRTAGKETRVAARNYRGSQRFWVRSRRRPGWWRWYVPVRRWSPVGPAWRVLVRPLACPLLRARVRL